MLYWNACWLAYTLSDALSKQIYTVFFFMNFDPTLAFRIQTYFHFMKTNTFYKKKTTSFFKKTA